MHSLPANVTNEASAHAYNFPLSSSKQINKVSSIPSLPKWLSLFYSGGGVLE